MTSQLDRIESKLDSHTDRLARMETRLEEYISRTDDIEEKVEKLTKWQWTLVGAGTVVGVVAKYLGIVS